jgi:hypothetical protein
VQGAGRYLESATFRQTPPELQREDLAAIIIDVRHWIRHHRC